MSNRVSSTITNGQRPAASSNAGSAEIQNPAPGASMVYVMPNFSNPPPPNCSTLPILVLDYQVPYDRGQIHHSFGVKPTSFRTVQMNLGPSSFPAIVWQGEESILCLVFPTTRARAKCIRRVENDKVFGMNLEQDLQASFLLRDLRTSAAKVGVELLQVCGTKHAIMSSRIGERGFVTVDLTWSEPPHFISFDSIIKLGSSGNWAFVLIRDEAKGASICIIECDRPAIARDVVWSLKRRAQRQISVSKAILSVTMRDVGEGQFDVASHSEAGDPNRVPFNAAWNRFRKSITGHKRVVSSSRIHTKTDL